MLGYVPSSLKELKIFHSNFIATFVLPLQFYSSGHSREKNKEKRDKGSLHTFESCGGSSMEISSFTVTVCCCQGFLLLVCDQGVTSGIIGADNKFAKDFNYPNSTTQGTIIAIYDIGCVIGSIMCFYIGERMGRRRMIMAGGITMLIGTAILTSSLTRAQLIVGRIVTGIGNGFNSSTIPVNQTECSPARAHGMLLTTQAVVTIFGLCIAYWLDCGTSFSDSPLQWRLPLGFPAVFALFPVLQVLGLPGAPRWLVAHDRSEEAAEVLANLERKEHTPDHPRIVALSMEIEASAKLESAGGPFKAKELFSTDKIQNFRRILLAIAVIVMQLATGANMINYYTPVVYQSTMGLSRNMPLILGGATSMTYLVGSIIPLFIVHHFGRRPLPMFSSAGLCFCFSMAAILLSIGTVSAAYGACSMAIGSAFNWMAVFAVVEITPIAIESINRRTFIIFAIFNALWIPVVYCFFPETTGLNLEDVDHLFDRGGLTGGVWSKKGQTVKWREL
ncbi:general substrate transporter [Choiromyces venosus 120613-1]|uniref:General substrate transporter n=1 Tax=Choiromyces venosus 120613-1 TaxID=1336337 RepID=A0A3N4IZV6_9PEZI|nr:general substrate transporter [Choiromyces venosus 120613-1]